MDSKREALIFDFDGVIADTEPLYWRAWCEILRPFDIPFQWADYCRLGRGIRDEAMLDSMTGLIPNPDVLAEIRRRLPERREMVRTWRHAAPPISDVTVQLLESLKGRTLGLVTSSDHSDIKPVLSAAGIMECFDACVFGEEMTRHKPDPAPYLLIRKKLAISGGVVFEDSEAGLQSAAGAGFRTVRVGRPDELPALVRNVIDSEENSLP